MNIRNMTENAEIDVNRSIERNFALQNRPIELSSNKVAIDNLIAEGGDSFYNYVDWIGLIKDPDLIVLSAVHHYYFDNEEMKNTNTIINLKQLNLIKDVDLFFHSIFKIIQPKSNFIGCFLDHKTNFRFAVNNIISQSLTKNKIDPYENGITSRIPLLNSLYKFMDSKTDRSLTRDKVSLLLNKQGFKALDMTELNGLTYFHSQKTSLYIN